MPLKKNNPGCICCESGLCSRCITAPATVTVTMSGWTNNTCTDCNVLNSSFICTATLAECYWLFSQTGYINCSSKYVSIALYLSYLVSEYIWYVQVNVGPTQWTYWAMTGLYIPDPIDCTAPYTANFISVSGTQICTKPPTIRLN